MKILSTILILLHLGFASLAQFPGGGPPAGAMGGMERPSPEEAAKYEAKKMAKKLGLDAATKASFEKIAFQASLEMDKLFESIPRNQMPPSEETRKKMREGFTSIQAKKETSLAEILTAEQLEQYKEIVKAERAAMMQQRGGGRP